MIDPIKAFLVPIWVFGLAGTASASRFDKPPETYATMLNEVLQQSGSDLRFGLDRCTMTPRPLCQYSTRRVAVIVEATEDRSGIGRIVIAADLLRDHPATLPHVPVIDALITLTATMVVFDPELPGDRRDGIVSALAEAVHGTGEGSGSGIAADYVITLDQASTTLLVITMQPKPKS